MSKAGVGERRRKKGKGRGWRCKELGLLNSLLGFHFPSSFTVRFCQEHSVPGARGLPLSAATAINKTEL